MRDRLLSMPTWALLLVTGLLWFAVLFVIGLIEDDDLWRAFVPAAIGGVIMAAATTFPLRYGLRTEQRALGDVSQFDQRVALRAARKGPVPADPAARAAALRLAEKNLEQVRRSRPLLAAAGSLFVVAQIGLAFSSSSVWNLLLLVPLVPALAFSLFRRPGRLRARVAVLSQAQDSPSV
jgi:uncharacterized membrane protein